MLKLDRKALLEDVKERLADRLPRYAQGGDDPTDPGWLLLEQAAWMVEVLTERMDEYPFKVVQQLVHVMGGQVKPAQPAVGAVVIEVSSEGDLGVDPVWGDGYRMFTPQTERADSVEFVPVEHSAPLRLGAVASMSQVSGGELFSCSQEPEGGVDGLVMWKTDPVRSRVFDRERVVFTIMTNNQATLKKALDGAVERFAERRIGWLRLSVQEVGRERISLTAEVVPAGAFSRNAPGGIWTGGDLVGDWGTLDDSTWTPPVRVADHPLLPSRLRGGRPMPSQEDGEILLPDVPADFPTDKLLVRSAAPLPSTVVDAIWQTVANLDGTLLPLHPSVSRGFVPEDEPDPTEPTWVTGALDSGLWHQLGTGPDRTVAQVRLDALRAAPGKVRVAVVSAGGAGEEAPALKVFGQVTDGRLNDIALKHQVVWRLPAPPPKKGQGLVWITALDVEIEPKHAGLLVVAEGDLSAVMMNAVLVANVPAVRDGRRVTVQRNVPEPVSMLYEDLVTPAVIRQLLEQPIPAPAAKVLRDLPLGHFDVEGQEPLESFAGVEVDASAGRMILNGPDELGLLRPFRPGTRIKMHWYRRTDGHWGEVGPQAISLIEQRGSGAPSALRVRNPLGTFFGASREAPEAAIDRLFAPAGGTPVLPSDFEREVRQALGMKGQGWMVRCWSYSERAMVPSAFWPLAGPFDALDPELLELQQRLDSAGPDQLLVVLGPQHGQLSKEELAWAEQVVRRRIRLISQRLPTIKDAIVVRYWPLVLQMGEGAAEPLLPCFDSDEMDGILMDELGRSASPPESVLLLNAAVSGVSREGQR